MADLSQYPTGENQEELPEVGSTAIRAVELLRLRRGDILIINTDEDPEVVAEGFKNALDHVGLTEYVSLLLHDGSVQVQLIRAEKPESLPPLEA